MDDSDLANIIILNDENGEEVAFEFLDLIEMEEREYVVLLPVGDDDDKSEVVILEVVGTDEESDEEAYVSVDDEGALMRVFDIFKKRFSDVFDFAD